MNPKPNQPTDLNTERESRMASAFDMSAESAEQATLDRLMRHTRHVVAEPRKASGFRWGWVIGPFAAAGAAAALTLAVTPSGPTESGAAGGGVIAAASEPGTDDAPSPERALAEVLLEADEPEVLAAWAGLDAFDGNGADWGLPDTDDLDDDDLEAWIAAYEAVLADG